MSSPRGANLPREEATVSGPMDLGEDGALEIRK